MSDLARVHAVLASGVEHPRLLEQWRQQPETLRELGIEPETLDLAALEAAVEDVDAEHARMVAAG